jgi:hypothetical protein
VWGPTINAAAGTTALSNVSTNAQYFRLRAADRRSATWQRLNPSTVSIKEGVPAPTDIS